ncbi:hypothetical protein C2G38_2156762 [Gigaspora rosea]|uniref:RSE1/DDB1/CPSF1 first beta-propeller domain-containing protein n=1 Tax=Gigaspora rosea TaxID=44941 RepID=A0A397W6G2_9GLOM|nr:hypothetical protein C2G38_2156762 [Gigaspora rosea]
MASYLDFSDRHRDLENSKLRVYAKTAVHSCVIHKMLVCALRGKERKDIILSKITQEGDLISIIEQPMFGTIKDLAALHCHFSSPLLFDPVNETVQMYLGDDISELQHLRVIPGQRCYRKNKAVTSIIGSCVETSRKTGRFQIIKEIPLSQPGFDYQKLGRLVCIDPSGCLIAVAAWQNIFQLFSLHRGPKVSFDQISQISKLAIVIYQFWAEDAPERNITSLPLRKNEPFPLHIIPLPNFPECFLLVNFGAYKVSTDLVLIKIVEKYLVCVFNEDKLGEYSLVLMTAFAYPADEYVPKRTSLLPHSSQQYGYAGVENGDFYRIDITSDVQIVYILLQKGLNSNGTVMTMLCFDPDVGDFVIISGEMSDGAVALNNALWNLKYNNDDKADFFLALSYANSTRLMNVSQGELHDISEYSGLLLLVPLPALYFKSIVWKLLYINKPNVELEAMVENTSSRWTPPENTVIDVVAVYDSIAVIVLSAINRNVIILLRDNIT